MSKGFWICAFGAVVCWVFAAANVLVYFSEGESWSLVAGVWCALMATWSTVNVVRIGALDREERRWHR